MLMTFLRVLFICEHSYGGEQHILRIVILCVRSLPSMDIEPILKSIEIFFFRFLFFFIKEFIRILKMNRLTIWPVFVVVRRLAVCVCLVRMYNERLHIECIQRKEISHFTILIVDKLTSRGINLVWLVSGLNELKNAGQTEQNTWAAQLHHNAIQSTTRRIK